MNRLSQILRSTALAIGVTAWVACGDATPDPDAAQPLPETSFPPALQTARVLYHRPDGIYLRTSEAPRPVKLVDNGTYPRWAPDGKRFAFLRGNEVMLYCFEQNDTQHLATASQGRALVFDADGREVLFTDDRTVRAVNVDSRAVRTVLEGPPFLELDIASDGSFLAATVRHRGYRVFRYALPSGEALEIDRGCSAGISPDNRWIMVNLDGHTRLALHDGRTGELRRVVHAPEGQMLDNQSWSNQPGWIAAIREGRRQDAVLQDTETGATWRITDEGDVDRPDLYVAPSPDAEEPHAAQ
jgi:hypothetical protein